MLYISLHEFTITTRGTAMSDSLGLKMEYDNILAGNQDDFSSAYIKKEAEQEDYMELMRYFFEEIMGWGPVEIEKYVTFDVIERMHMSKILGKIEFPSELDKEKDLFYLSNILYPTSSTNDKRTVILTVYKKVLTGELKKFPKNFFFLADSDNYYFVCLNYAMKENLFFKSIEEVYAFFADTDRASMFLESVRLLVPCRDNYDIPLDMIHDFLPCDQKDDSCYSYYKLTGIMNAHHKKRKNVGRQR